MRLNLCDILIVGLFLFAIGFVFWIAKYEADLDLQEKHKYDFLERQLNKSKQQRDSLVRRIDSLNIRYEALDSLNKIQSTELSKIKGRYNSKTSQELQKLMIDGAK